MNPKSPIPPANVHEEIPALIETLRATEQRLEASQARVGQRKLRAKKDLALIFLLSALTTGVTWYFSLLHVPLHWVVQHEELVLDEVFVGMLVALAGFVWFGFRRWHEVSQHEKVTEALRRLQDALETRIQHRTAELAGANDGLRGEINRRKRAEQVIARGLERLTEAQRIGQIGDWEWDIATQAITWSPQVFEILGRDPSLGPPRDYDEHAAIYDEASRRLMAEKVNWAIESGEPQKYELLALRPGGGGVYVQAMAVPSKDEKGRVVGLHGTIQDITERKQAETALRVNEERLRAALAASHTGTFRWEFSTDEVSWDKSLDALFGIPQGQKIHSLETFVATVHPDDRANVIERCERCARDGADFDMEFRVLWPDGSLHWLYDKGKTFFDVTGKPLYMTGACVDITERKQTEMALRASEAEFRALSEAMPQMVWITRPDGWNIYFSQQWMDYTGLSLEESLGHGWSKPFHPDDEQRAADAWQHATAMLGTYSVECRLRRADGVYRWWLVRGVPQRDATGRILKWFGTCTDIHDLKSAEREISRANEALSESKRFAESIAENSTSIIYIFDVEARRNDYANRSAAETLGYSSAQILEMGDSFLPKVIHPEDLPHVTQNHARLATEPDSLVVESEYRVKHAGGDWRWIWVRETVFKRRASGAVWQIMGTAQDITERKRSEAQLEKAHKELLEASRRAGMAEVATGILHNVGNVLNSVNIASSCIADSIRKSKAANLGRVVGLLREHEADLGDFLTVNPQGKQIPAYLAQLAEHLVTQQSGALTELGGLQKNIEHIKEIVALQQSLAKGSGVTERLSVANLVEDALKMYAGGLARHHILVIREFQKVPLVTVEKHQVLQILVNLVRNAQQACDESNRPEKQLTVRVTPGNGGVRIAVADNGMGILTENLTRIFAHGFTTKKSGHGFGLHSAALSAKQMGGSLTVHSEGAGRGATFTLELPLTRDAEPVEEQVS